MPKSLHNRFLSNQLLAAGKDCGALAWSAPVGQLDGQKYTFNKPVSSVSRADLVVLNSHVGNFHRIEIREVAFTGRPSVKSVPEPSNIGGLALVSIVGLGLLANKKRYKALN